MHLVRCTGLHEFCSECGPLCGALQCAGNRGGSGARLVMVNLLSERMHEVVQRSVHGLSNAGERQVDLHRGRWDRACHAKRLPFMSTVNFLG